MRPLLWMTVAAVAIFAPLTASQAAGQQGFGFVENVGQWSKETAFVGRCPGLDVFVHHDELVLSVRGSDRRQGHVIRLGLETPHGPPTGRGLLPQKAHFLLGNDLSSWFRNVRSFGAVRFPVTGGGELDVLLKQSGPVLSLQPADPHKIHLSVTGADGIDVDPGGAVNLLTSVGVVSLPPPQVVHGQDTRKLAFVRGVGRSLRLAKRVLDPRSGPQAAAIASQGLVFSTYLGGTGTETVTDVAFGPGGTVTVVGSSESVDLPVSSGAYSESLDPVRDAFISQLHPDGSLGFSTYLGGVERASDAAQEVEIGIHGDIYVAGVTNSESYPVTSQALQQTKVGLMDWFITRLTPEGSDIVWSTFLGGGFLTPTEVPMGMELTSDGDVIVCGQGSRTFPTTIGAFQEQQAGDPLNSFAVVARIDGSGSELVYSTFLNGTCSQSVAQDLAIATDESVYVIGRSACEGAPYTPGAVQGTPSAFHPANPPLARLSRDGRELIFAGSLGGSSVETLFGVSVDKDGHPVVVGETSSEDLPVTEDAALSGGAIGFSAPDAFVTVVDQTGSMIRYLTYVPGPDLDTAHDVVVDGSGALIVSGSTSSNAFPTTPGAAQEESLSIQEDVDLFVTRFAPDRRSVEYSTRLGGQGDEGLSTFTGPCAVALDPEGDVVIAGESFSDDYPTTPGAFQSVNMGRDAVITRLTLLPTGVTRFGASSPGCRGPLVISVTAMPQAGSRDFAVTCTKAPPHSGGGLLAVSMAALGDPLPLLGADVWIDPAQVIRLLPMRSNAIGYAEHTLPIASGLAQPLALQAFWPDACAPGGWSASAGLTVEVQP